MAEGWKAQLREASYNGVTFGVTSDASEGGRRVVVHEFPQSDAPYVEDMGGSIRKFTVEAFVLGSDYMSRRDALQAELEKPGPGLLVHPWYGEIQVSQVAPYKVSQSAFDGGMATFSLSFAVAGEPSAPSGLVNRYQKALNATNGLGLSICSSLDNLISLANQAEWVVENTYNAIVDGIDTVQKIIGGDVDTIAGLLGAATGHDLGGLVSVGEAVWGALDTIGQSSGVADHDLARNWCTVASASYQAPQFAHMGSQSTIIVRNANAVGQAIRQLAVVESVRAALNATPSSRSEAESLRYDVIDALDAITIDVPEEPDLGALGEQASTYAASQAEIYASFVDLRTEALSAIADMARKAPDVQVVAPAAVLPSLALVYRYSGGIELEQDLVQRNSVLHPGFVPVRALEVLTNA